MLFSLEVLPAAEGDCLLLYWGAADDVHVAVIDGGPGRIYEDVLRPRLNELVANLETDRLNLDLVMVSHMDYDHIIGIKKLVADVKRKIANGAPIKDRTIGIRRLWLNVFNDILGDSIDRYYKTLTASLQASVGGEPNPEITQALATAFENRHALSEDDALENAQTVAAVLAGHGEGRTLRDDHKFLFDANQTAPLNNPFVDSGGRPTLVTLEKTSAPLAMDGLDVTIVGPAKAEIEALQREFDEYIEEKGMTVEAVLAAYADRSIKNLSSIACLVEVGGERILLTGDARGDHTLDGLRAQDLLDDEGVLDIEVLKVPHHGSDRNVNPDFFETIRADTYILSGDGKNGNPDRDTLEWIVSSRGPTAVFDVILTYDVDTIDVERKAFFEKNQKKKADPLKWSPQRHSLAAFFEEKAAEGYSFTLIAGAPAMVDLGDEEATF